MRDHATLGKAASALALAASAILAAQRPSLAGEPTVPESRRPVLAAIEMTRQRGVPTVLIVASRRVPASVAFAEAFASGEWARRQRGLAQVLPVVLEDDPQLVASLNVSHFPSALAYCPGAKGLARYETSQECGGDEALGAWLDRLVSPPSDASIGLAGFHGDAYPSTQGYAAPPPQPSAPPTAQVAPPTVGLTPSVGYAPQVTTTASVVQMPGQSFVIQQQAPQIFMAPSPAPVVYVPQGTAAAPPAMAVAAPAPVANMFLPAATPTLSAAPTLSAPPALGVAAAPTVAAAPALGVAAMPATGVALAAQPTSLAVTNQQLNLPTNARTSVRVRGPGPICASLARVGERLTRLGRTRIETVQRTTLEAPVPQVGAPGMTSISTTSAVPVGSPAPQAVAIPVQAPAQPPAQVAVPYPVERPTPQGYPAGHHH
jgi:hypothetical protein